MLARMACWIAVERPDPVELRPAQQEQRARPVFPELNPQYDGGDGGVM
jgi:hypothetical protein